jgi:hypothetical protein
MERRFIVHDDKDICLLYANNPDEEKNMRVPGRTHGLRLTKGL